MRRRRRQKTRAVLVGGPLDGATVELDPAANVEEITLRTVYPSPAHAWVYRLDAWGSLSIDRLVRECAEGGGTTMVYRFVEKMGG